MYLRTYNYHRYLFTFLFTIAFSSLSPSIFAQEESSKQEDSKQTIAQFINAHKTIQPESVELTPVAFTFTIPGEYPLNVTLFFENVPENLRNWTREKLVPVMVQWYPMLQTALWTDGYKPLKDAIIIFRPGEGVAYTAGNRIVCFSDWFSHNLEGEALGAFVHELTHLVQQYPGGTPTWLTEGFTDYIRWHLFEPRPQAYIDFRRAKYTDSYRTTAAFINFVTQSYPELPSKLNQVMRTRTYREDFWKKQTGKTVDELWNEFRIDWESKHKRR